jgi:putative peptidoglycan lipid II flippase
LSALSLQAFAIGLIGFSFVKILAPAYFAREDTKTPVRVGLIALLVNFVLSVIFALLLTHIGFAGTHAGLALAISIAALVNAWLLYRGLWREQLIKHSPGWISMLTRFVIGNVAMTMSIVALNRPLDWWLEAAILQRSGWLGFLVGTAAAVYFGVLLVVGVRPGHLRLNKR